MSHALNLCSPAWPWHPFAAMFSLSRNAFLLQNTKIWVPLTVRPLRLVPVRPLVCSPLSPPPPTFQIAEVRFAVAILLMSRPGCHLNSVADSCRAHSRGFGLVSFLLFVCRCTEATSYLW